MPVASLVGETGVESLADPEGPSLGKGQLVDVVEIGFGGSDCVEPDVAVFAETLEKFIAHPGAGSLHLTGHSMGGAEPKPVG